MLLCEVIKLAASAVLVRGCRTARRCSLWLQLWREAGSLESARRIAVHACADARSMALMAVPALCFIFQNYMMFVALANLDISTSQVPSSPRQFSAFTPGR